MKHKNTAVEATAENLLHWSEEKEVISSNRPLMLLFILMKHIPSFLVFSLIFPVGFFFLIFSARARNEAVIYQRKLKEFIKKNKPENSKKRFRISPYKQIVSFCLCVLEKMMGWLGKFKYKELITQNDDLPILINQLENGKGAVIISSHLGNVELLRSLSSFNQTGVSKEVPVTIIMEVNATEQFTNTLNKINPKSSLNIISPDSIGPDTICRLQEEIEKGGLIVFAADRTSAGSRGRTITQEFLGAKAEFPYGVFLLCALLNAPMYYFFALRTRTATIFPKYNMFVEKSAVSFDCSRSEREQRINELEKEFVSKLEKYCVKFPYQWYNFYNFWLRDENSSEKNTFNSRENGGGNNFYSLAI